MNNLVLRKNQKRAAQLVIFVGVAIAESIAGNRETCQKKT